jgi:hypothetical protein
MKNVMVGVLWLILLAAVSAGYLAYVAPLVPKILALITNILLVPFVIGCVAFFLLRGPVLIKGIALAAIPVLHVALFGGDPAKPGLELEVALVEYALMLLGLFVAAGSYRMFGKANRDQTERTQA